jgi:hypothetical protein
MKTYEFTKRTGDTPIPPRGNLQGLCQTHFTTYLKIKAIYLNKEAQ